MLGRNNSNSNSGSSKRKSASIDTLVGSNTRVSGDVQFSGGFHVDGYIKGNINADADSESVLSISENGTVEGSVSVPHVILNGTVKGDVTAKERVELGSTARVIGNVFYNLIEMAIGAEINGKLIHQPKGQPTLVDLSSKSDDSLVQVGGRK
ncbi:MAG: polymer-forming cytoskeletal protein [Gammaproteobacteria bacterium]|nr:polymer-forming cytoskeletal protein [Gammaproteobacteria bacterium]